ncbi:MAG: assimilatory sulfite reductase (NADPH) flavoprotein subunit [Acetobacteraceae bacterium]
MLTAAKLPDNAPFPPEAISALNRVIAHANAAQRSWLSGFLAGVEAAAGTAPAAAPVKKHELTILFATESGNAEALAARAKREAGRLGFAAKLLDAAEATPAALAKAKTLLVIASTWGEGEAPQRATGFLKALLAEDAPRLEGVNFAVLALGDRAYAQFCETGRIIDDRLAALGATRAAARIDCDLDYESPAAAWLGATLPALRKEEKGEASVIHVDFGHADAGLAEAAFSKANPFQAEVSELVNLNSSRSGKQTFHMELSLAGSGITYEPGDALGIVPQNDPAVAEAVLAAAGLAGDAALHQALVERHEVTTLTGYLVKSYAALIGDAGLAALAADPARLAEYVAGRQVIDLLQDYPNRLSAEQLLGLLRPLPPRLYSIASSQRATPDEAHLLVSAVRYRTHGRERAGVASTWVADRRRVGDTVPVYVKPNTHFRLPADPATPIIMVGPGTGVAPFRAFMQERDATEAKGKSWLFFGDQHYTHDFLYQLEWQDLLARGVLSKLDVAFSRDQDAKSYVQHRMLEQAAALHAWLEEGAHFYVCGDQTRMARDVHAALRTVVARGAAVSEEAAEGRLETLKQQGRYKLDVY